MSERFRRFAALLACALFAVVLVTGCSSPPDGETSSAGTGKGDMEKAPTLDEFLAADTLTADFTLKSTESNGEVSFEGTGTLWLQERQFRYSLWQDGTHVRDIMSPDGETAYFVEYEGEYCEPSVASVDRYLAEFSEPATSSVEDGADEETGALRVVYPVQQVDNIAGSANGWYTEDITYLVEDGGVIGTITRGDTPKEAGESYDLRTTRRIFSNLIVGEAIPADTFELPFPIKNAEE